MKLLLRNIVISAIALGAIGCSPLYNYVASGRDSPWNETVFHTDENGVRLKSTGLIYYIDQSPKVYETVLELTGFVDEKLEFLPETIGVDIIHDGRSLMKSGQVTIKKNFTSATICGEKTHRDKIRAGGLPTPLVVPKKCAFSIVNRYIFEMPVRPKEVEVNAQYEYKSAEGNVRVNESLKVNLNRENFWWIYAT